MYNQANAMANSYGSVASAGAQARLAFIRKVYLCMSGMLLIAMGTCALSIQQGWAFSIATKGGLLPWLGIIAFGFVIHMIRKVPGLNLLALGAMGAVIGVFFSPIIYFAIGIDAARGNTNLLWGTVGQAFMLTSAVFVGLTAYVFITKKDFSWMGGMLFTGFIILIVAMLGFYFFGIPGKAMYTLYLAFGTLLFTGYILYDTSVIIHHLAEDEYVIGALNLFFDFVNLFIFILQLLMSRD